MNTSNKLTPKVRIFFVCNYNFRTNGKINRKKLLIKSFLFLLYTLKLCNLKYRLTFYKKKKNKINILNAPYKNKLAQRQFTLSRLFFFLDIEFKYTKQTFNYFFFLLKKSYKLCTLGSLFFNVVKVKTILKIK